MTDQKPNSRANKSRIEEIDDMLEEISRDIAQLNDFVFVSKTELEFSLITAKVKREKVNALAGVAKFQVLLANMDILIAESDLRSDLERLRNYQQKLKMERLEGKTLEGATEDTPAASKKKGRSKSSSSQTSNPKKRKKSSDVQKPAPADISSDETVIIEALPESKIGSLQSLHDCLTQLPKPRSPTESEISLPSFIKAEFNCPYEESDNQKQKKSDSKGKSSSTKHQSPSNKTKTVADIKKTILASKSDISKDISSSQTPKSSRQKSDDRRATPTTSTYVPIRHNMPQIITQAKNYYRAVPTTDKSPSQSKATPGNINNINQPSMTPNNIFLPSMTPNNIFLPSLTPNNIFQPSMTPNINFYGSKK